MPIWIYHEKSQCVTGTHFWDFFIYNHINDAMTKKIIQTFEDLIETQKNAILLHCQYGYTIRKSNLSRGHFFKIYQLLPLLKKKKQEKNTSPHMGQFPQDEN